MTEVRGAATGDGQVAEVQRVKDSLLISSTMHEEIGTNINGPAVLRVPDWIERPLGKYYMYFAAHRGSFLRLAVSDDPAGPWRYIPGGVLPLERSLFIDHVASPDVVVDEETRQIRLYFHGLLHHEGYEQATRVALSDDGLHFAVRPELLGQAYLRVFRLGAYWYAVGGRGVTYRSRDGLTDFKPGPRLLPEFTRHVGVLVDDAQLTIVYSRIGDMPEGLLYSRVDTGVGWPNWQATPPLPLLAPERDYEGGDLSLTPSFPGDATEPLRQLRDPAPFRDKDGSLFVYYAAAGESGIAAASVQFLP